MGNVARPWGDEGVTEEGVEGRGLVNGERKKRKRRGM